MATDGKAPSREELIASARALVEVGRAIYETIHEAGPLGAPESVIHMALAERGMSDRVAAGIIDALTAGGLVERRNHRAGGGGAVIAADVLFSVQEDDFAPRRETLAEFLAACPEDAEGNRRAAALAVGESFQIDEGPLAHAPTWTITRVR